MDDKGRVLEIKGFREDMDSVIKKANQLLGLQINFACKKAQVSNRPS